MDTSSDPSTLLFKIIVVGDSGVGKTSIINRYVHGFFSKTYKSTIGVDFALKELDVDDKHVKLQLWDIAGQERYNTLTHIYYRQAVGAILVFDLSKPESYEHIKHWKKDIDEKVFLDDGGDYERNIPCVLLANKADLQGSVSKYKEEILGELDQYIQDHGYKGHFKTSALKNEGIDTAIEFLIRQVYKETESIDEMNKKSGKNGGGPRNEQIKLKQGGNRRMGNVAQGGAGGGGGGCPC